MWVRPPPQAHHNMTKEISSEKQTHRQVESQRLNLESIHNQFDAALDAAMERVNKGLAKVEYQFRDGIQDGRHLEHIRVTDVDGTILYDQDFELEDAVIRQVDSQDN